MLLTTIDTELTGLQVEKHEIIEFAAIKYNIFPKSGSQKEISRTSFKIKPLRIDLADPVALSMNGYNEKDWSDARPIGEALSDIKVIVEEAECLLGQCLITDLRFINKYFDSLNFPTYIDTKHMALNLKQLGKFSNTSLDYLCQHYNIQYSGDAHNALPDCERTFKLYNILKELTTVSYWTFANPFERESNFNKVKL